MTLAIDDHRIALRRRILKAGTISFGGGAITCAIRNISATGAALEVESSLGIPDRFSLVLEMEHRQRSCAVMWRKEKRIGVRFMDN